MAVLGVIDTEVPDTFMLIWGVKRQTTTALHQCIQTVMEWAIVMEFENTCCDCILTVLGLQCDIVQ